MACSSFNWRFLFACSCLSSFFLGVFVLMPTMLALFAYPSRPSFSIDLFYNQSTFNVTRADNLTIHFDLKLKNKNPAIGLHYPDPIKITFSYFPNVSMMVTLAEYQLDSFYQGNHKTRHVRDAVETKGFPTVLEGTDIIAFRVDFVGTFRYKKAGTKRHKLDLGCPVIVNYTTTQKMKSGFIALVQPGLDSELAPPVKEDNYAYTNF